MNIPSYNKENRKTSQDYSPLPKGNYVCKIMNVEEAKTRDGHPAIRVYFDIAEGPYKDYYAEKYKADDREDKKWNNDGVYWLNIPYDGCPAYIIDNYDTFWANVEDSNNGYRFTGDEKTIKGKVFGAAFKIEQSSGKNRNGETRVYNHTKIARTFIAQDVRDGKIKYTPQDKIISAAPSASGNDDFMQVTETAPDGLPF